MTIRILIADDHSVVRQGLRMFLGSDPEIEIVGEARDGAEAVKLALPASARRRLDGPADARHGRHQAQQQPSAARRPISKSWR